MAEYGSSDAARPASPCNPCTPCDRSTGSQMWRADAKSPAVDEFVRQWHDNILNVCSAR